MLILIVGRTGSGKTELKNILTNNYGWNFLKTYTTRPKRTPNEDDYHFISEKEADLIPKEQRAAETTIGEYQYFSTIESINKNIDAYIIDPNGIKSLLEKMPNECFHVLYLQSDPEIAKEFCKTRGSDEKLELQRFESRSKAEDKQFTEWETMLKEQPHQERLLIDIVKNDYTEGTMSLIAAELDETKRYYENIIPIIQASISACIIQADAKGNPMIQYGKNETPVSVTKERMAQLMNHKGLTPLSDILLEWLGTPGVCIQETGTIPVQDNTIETIEEILQEPEFRPIITKLKEEMSIETSELYDSITQSPEFKNDYNEILKKHISRTLLNKITTEKK